MNLSEKVSQFVKNQLADELRPLLQSYCDHQGWPSFEDADVAMQALIDLFCEMGVTF
jgi:hypothetical protein